MKKGGQLCREILITVGGSVHHAAVTATVEMTGVTTVATAGMTAETTDVMTDVTAGMIGAMTDATALNSNLEPFRRLLKI